tara:strand:- start:101 stop:421 length:321 start_codon:yes stop_codon:yes gene_type:complete
MKRTFIYQEAVKRAKQKNYIVTIKSLEQRSKPALLRMIRNLLKNQSKKKLAQIAYMLLKSTLPRLKTIKRKALPGPKRKTKRKFSRKQLAAQRLFAKRARAGTLRR